MDGSSALIMCMNILAILNFCLIGVLFLRMQKLSRNGLKNFFFLKSGDYILTPNVLLLTNTLRKSSAFGVAVSFEQSHISKRIKSLKNELQRICE